jgi:hypothetical protein
MNSDAEILAPRGQVGPFELAFLLMLALPTRRGHSVGLASV